MNKKTRRRRPRSTAAVLYGASKGSRYRESLGYGNFRYVPDRYHEQSENWFAKLYDQRPETVGQNGQPKRKARERRGMWYDRY